MEYKEVWHEQAKNQKEKSSGKKEKAVFQT